MCGSLRFLHDSEAKEVVERFIYHHPLFFSHRLGNEIPQWLVRYKSLNDPSAFGLTSKRKLKNQCDTTVYTKKEEVRKLKEKEKGEKELTCVYAYNDGGNDGKRVQGL